MPSIADLLIEQGRVQADLRRRQGERKGAMIAGLGQIPGQIMEDRAAQQAAQARAAQMAEEMAMRRAADARAGVATDLAIHADARTQETHDNALQSEERGKQAVMGWMKQHANTLKPEEAARMEAILQMPGGAKHLVENLSKAPEPFTLNPGDVRFGPDGQKIADNPKPVEEKAITYTAPQPYMVNGKRTLARAGSDGALYDMKGQKIDNAQPDVSPSTAQGPQPSWQWVTRVVDGKPKEVYTNRVLDGDRPNTARVKATEDERKTAGFYGQMSDAIQTIDGLESRITEKELYQIQTLPHEKLIGMMNRGQLSEDAKRYLRAFEQFTESRLRPVSGAAIADGEYARDRRTYAKQYGETPKLAEDRKRARDGALAGLKKRAGVALDDANVDPKAGDEQAPVKPKGNDPLGIL